MEYWSGWTFDVSNSVYSDVRTSAHGDVNNTEVWYLRIAILTSLAMMSLISSTLELMIPTSVALIILMSVTPLFHVSSTVNIWSQQSEDSDVRNAHHSHVISSTIWRHWHWPFSKLASLVILTSVTRVLFDVRVTMLLILTSITLLILPPVT